MLRDYYNYTQPFSVKNIEEYMNYTNAEAQDLFDELLSLGYIHESGSLFGIQYYVNGAGY